jgi:membrane protein DedA with SNARE-associated domain
MFEEIVNNISNLTPFWIYVSLFCFSYIENVFPPSPSDLVVIIGGTLISKGTISFLPTLILTSVGSVLGFLTLYFIGTQVDKKLIRAGKVKYVSLEALEKAEAWFNKYGYIVILINRYLPGTRSVISFFAGLSELILKKTAILAFVSAITWNALIIWLGIIFFDNVEFVDKMLATYSTIVLVIIAAAVVFFIVRYFIKKKKK